MTMRRSARRIIASVFAVVAVASVVPVVDAPSVSAAPGDLFTLQGETGDFIVGPQSLSYSSFTVEGGPTGIAVKFATPIAPVYWDVRLSPPPGQSLDVGFYEDATRWPSNASGVPGLEVSGSGRGCNTLSGRFVIDEVAFNGSGVVTTLVAHWEQHCENLAPASFGTVSWHGTKPLSPMNAVASGNFPAVTMDTVAASKAQPIVNQGGTPLAVTSVSITGTDASQFEITADPCSGTIIPVGGSCSVQVAFAPTQMGVSHAALTVVDGLHPAGFDLLPLRGGATPRVARIWTEAEQDGSGSASTHRSYAIQSMGIARDIGSVKVLSTAPVSLEAWFGTEDRSPLTVGSYEGAERYDIASVGHPRFELSGGFFGCNTLSARFVVDQLERRPDGTINRFVAHWEHRCEGSDITGFGGVNYNGTVPFVERAIGPNSYEFAPVTAGLAASTRVTISNLGPSPLHIASTALTGNNPSQFTIIADDCAGTTVAAGSSCAVDVRYHPSSPGSHTAKLTVIDDVAQAVGIGSGQDVRLIGAALDEPIFFLEGEDDDTMVGPEHMDLSAVQVNGDDTRIYVFGNQGRTIWYAVLTPKKGTTFAAGASITATQQVGTNDAAHAGLGVFVNNESCTTSTGRLVIRQLTFNANRTVKSLVARWEYHCDGEAASSFGGARFNSTTAFGVSDLTDAVTWEQVPNHTPGATKDIVLNAAGAAAIGVGQVALTGPGVSQFQVVSDGCSNTTIPGGGRCTVRVRFVPTATNLGEKVARLVVPHSGALLSLGGSGQDVVLRGSSTAAASSNFGELTLVSPARLLDTRTGVGAPRARLGANSSLTVQVTGRGGVPATGVGSVIVNVTTTLSTITVTHLTVWPAGTTRPGVSTMFPIASMTLSNLATVRLGTGGRIQVYNATGSTDVAVDVVGWYSDANGPNGARFHPLTPGRAVSTTTGTGVAKAPIASGATLKVDLRGKAGIPLTGAVAVAVNVTATRPTSRGSLTVFAGDRPRPSVPSLSFAPGLTANNMVVVRLPANGVVQFFNSAGNTHLAVDVLGYWTLAANGNSGRYVPVTQVRALDTRREGGPLRAGVRSALQIGGQNGVAHDAGAAVLNVVAVQPGRNGLLRVVPDQVCSMRPTTTLDYVLGRTVANAAWSPLSSDAAAGCAAMPGAIDIYISPWATNVLVDVSGYFTP